MRYLAIALALFLSSGTAFAQDKTADFTIAFGSCNKASLDNPFWDNILTKKPDVWIWGGDNVYADTDDPNEMKIKYNQQLKVPAYKAMIEKIPVIGTWDDHDYGKNDAGAEYGMKENSQQLFLDFMGVSETDQRRNREGVYASHEYKTSQGKIKVIVLDTRYFRGPIERVNRTYIPNETGTILGEEQWKWLETELETSDARFNVIVSSIQILPAEHRFEKWANFPNERQRLFDSIRDSGAEGVLLLSGDRHISEFSKLEMEGLEYPLWDFTSSGLTHSYSSFKEEPNQLRVGDVVSSLSYGLLHFDFDAGQVIMQMRGESDVLIQEFTQIYN
ncbi:MAG: alkaline phosphatase D family protein [Bacteroidota bacterium]